MTGIRFLLLATALIMLSVTQQSLNAQPLFEDIAPQVGLNNIGSGGGSFWYDYDRDGDLDLVQTRRFTENTHLYRNDGTAFTDITDIGLPENWDIGGFIPFDFDQDGDVDIFFPSYHYTCLMLVCDSGAFTDQTAALGLSGLSGSRDVKLVDFNRDGYMDILYCDAYQGYYLFRNDNGIGFTNVTEQTQLPEMPSFHRTCESDIDLDGDTDLFATAIDGPEHLFENQGGGIFTDITEAAGLADLQAHGGCAWADINHDKYPDLLTQGVGHHSIWINNQNNTFTEMNVHGTETDFESAWPYSADYAVGDFDMDGDLDFYACRPGGNGDGQAENQLFLQTAQSDLDIWFADVAADLGMDIVADGNPVAADYDYDGDLDLFVTIHGAASRLYRNNTNSRNALYVDLYGPNGDLSRWLTRVELYPHGSNVAIQASELNTSNVNRSGLGAYFVAGETGSYDLRIFFADGTTMTPDNCPQLAGIVPSEIGHRFTVYMGNPDATGGQTHLADSDFRLGAAYPNPFNATLTIPYHIAQTSDITLSVFNITGQKVATLVKGLATTGEHRTTWDASHQASGVYLIELQSSHHRDMQKVVLVK